ncbi:MULTISPECIES: ABC transporter permease [unclassified Streptomyces]|uniref:ABC transporter permease n=1 Tax=unclassified Streptomyces TaxID=2593676 RepID=UPI002DD9ADFB|nr:MULTISPECIES: ABC transporter permease [unclassified Streptomyces]WSA92552.1 ABC transporter permease [Streptomyces sp. NBC_01795]WSB76919.1 ABC transporter permease [Streptomyces sp. NBC_01775]WSS14808.1 ABC transporter permease [Streptomyces sp. NBC_01186]WSS43642.1 ABC transporter permease [Streptomyces sp. NBC_01187]
MTSPSQAATAGADTPGPDDAGLSSTRVEQKNALVGRSPGQLMWIRFKRDRTGVISACIVLAFCLIAALAPVISKLYGKDAYTRYGQTIPGLLNDNGYPVKPNGGISSEYWFGIEPDLGRDVFMQLVYGIRTSLSLAIAITLLSVITAIVIGVAGGYLGGRTDYFLGRLTDLMMSFPNQLFFIAFTPVVMALFVDPQDQMPTWMRACVLIYVMWLLGWMTLARLLRGQTLSLREREFVEAAKVAGTPPGRIIRKELLPNLVTPILVQSTYMLPNNVTAIAGLSFLGVGMPEPVPDWGRMFATGADIYQSDITYMFFPGGAMVIFILAFNLLGDSVRDAFDPKSGR